VGGVIPQMRGSVAPGYGNEKRKRAGSLTYEVKGLP